MTTYHPTEFVISPLIGCNLACNDRAPPLLAEPRFSIEVNFTEIAGGTFRKM